MPDGPVDYGVLEADRVSILYFNFLYAADLILPCSVCIDATKAPCGKMTSASHSSVTYLVGFSPEIDGRPFCFAKPLPSVRYCYICNIVPRTIYVLECLHPFCKTCYDRIVAKGPWCPVDGNYFNVEVVRELLFTPDRLKETKVICQNSNGGCGFVGNVMDIVEHSLRSCGFLMVTCRRCNESVRKDDMLEHSVGGGCKAASYVRIPVLDLHAGEPPGSRGDMPALSEPTVLLIGGGDRCPMKDTGCEASTVEDEGIAMEDGTPRKLSDAEKTPQPEYFELLSAEEEKQFRTRRSRSSAPSARRRVFDGSLQQVCQRLLSLMSHGSVQRQRRSWHRRTFPEPKPRQFGLHDW
ncbi:uncharacterized protein LOC135391953 [Ornithodoros turicata]|uniref:uncharacterized protein LOC135391953 n=1 Tax=Ornithodoros turicata TaxID=34597 RepID=UPI00313A48B3